MKNYIISITILIFVFICISNAETNLEIDGEVSVFANYGPDNYINTQFAGRYLPEILYSIDLGQGSILDFDLSANLNGSLSMHPFDTAFTEGEIEPYRLWARYYGNQYEIRLGLQKIDFGTATLLRPLQWFNQVDPRDPLKITNGVYGLLGRYYFLNNANVWAWVLYGNEKRRGLDAVESNKELPEFGARVQYPTPLGEIALSYHHRTANANNLLGSKDFEKIPEDRIGIDGKWDVGVGLWFEAVYIHKSKEIGMFTNQSLFNIGTDYTFDIGNGLNVLFEHLILTYDKTAFKFAYNNNISASSISYPLGLNDNISSIFSYDWNSNEIMAFLNFQHQFDNFMGYIMAYYNPKSTNNIQENVTVNDFTGPGIQIMIVYNH